MTTNRTAAAPTTTVICLDISLPLFEPFQYLEKCLIVRQGVKSVDIDVTDNALLIHDENRPLGHTVLTQDTIRLRYLSVRPVIAQYRNIFHTHGRHPRRVRIHAVHRYTQNLGIYRLEARQVGFIGGHLLGSDGSERARQESEYDVFLS